MMRSLIFVILLVSVTVADEHWFVFDQHQFPGFYTPLFTIAASSSNSDSEQKNLSFALSTYERSISIDITNGNADGTRKQHEQAIKLNIERADLLSNTFNHLIFVALRQRTKLETYVNCKLMDSYLLYSLNTVGGKEFEDADNELTIEKSEESIKYFHSSTDDHYQQHVFEKFGCKYSGTPTVSNNKTTVIGRSLIRKMQHVIEKVQRRKQRARRNPNEQASLTVVSNSLTIVYKPNVLPSSGSGLAYKTIVKVAQLAVQIHYYPFEHLFHIRFNNENRTQVILYADKATDLVPANQTGSTSNSMVLFLHITPSMVSCYVNCELTDQEFILDSMYVQNIIRQMNDKTNAGELIDPQVMEYHRQSTLVLFNKSIEQVAANFFCTKLDKKHEELLPDKYALRKFANALDMLVNSLDGALPFGTATTTSSTPNVAMVTIHSINAYGSLIGAPPNTEATPTVNEIAEYDKLCSTDQECQPSNTMMKCQQKHCTCPTRHFWSPLVRRCIACKDVSIGNRCFRLANHKSTWYEANDFCQEESTSDDQPEYTMKLASNLNRTDIELLKRSLLSEDDGEQLDYFYWIGLTSQFDTRKLHQHPARSKRRVPTTIFRWYDNGETAALNMVDIWCSQNDANAQNSLNNNELCVSLTTCGLYADDCQRNYRFLCEAV